MTRVSIKIAGSQGQGLISIGDILAKAFKRSGYCVFGYREYMSLIKGGYSSYQIDISDALIQSSEEKVDVLIILNHHGFELSLSDIKDGGILIHDSPAWNKLREDTKYLANRGVRTIHLPVASILQKLKAKPILANVIFSAFAWSAFGGDKNVLKTMVGEKFASKKDLLALNMQAIDEGFAQNTDGLKVQLPKADTKKWADHMLLTGSQAMGLGTVHAGVRFYAGYPMTPSSPLLSYIAEIQNETGMAIKQAEDEITAAQMMSGAMFMGTRALTATSGGGFDLMTETLSLDGMIENPAVFVLAQRPGPATGLPTWTAQGDLMLAAFGGHGEFARVVLSVSDADDAFHLVNDAFNMAEEFQTPVILMTDKHTAEGIYTQQTYDQKKTLIRRGKLVTSTSELKKLKSSDRYDPNAKDGISPRWLPGTEAATYVAQGDEHSADGSVDETADNAIAQMKKRMKKLDAMKKNLPEPELYVTTSGELRATSKNEKLDLLVIGWGSTKGVIFDAISQLAAHNSKLKIGYLHYTWLWPLKTERLEKLLSTAKKSVIIEGNATAQLATLIRMQSGIDLGKPLLKYDGRPFFLNELITSFSDRLRADTDVRAG